MGRKKLTAAQKAANKVERERKKINARNLKEVGGAGSLFAYLAEEVTFDQAAWNMRRTKGLAVEQMHASPCSPLAFAFDHFRVNVVESFARTVFTAGEFEELRAYCHHTYPSPVYWRSFWKGVLTGEKRAVLSIRREPAANTFGFRVVPDRELPAVGFVPPLTPAGFDARFPAVEAKQTAEAETSDATFAAAMAKIHNTGE